MIKLIAVMALAGWTLTLVLTANGKLPVGPEPQTRVLTLWSKQWIAIADQFATRDHQAEREKIAARGGPPPSPRPSIMTSVWRRTTTTKTRWTVPASTTVTMHGGRTTSVAKVANTSLTSFPTVTGLIPWSVLRPWPTLSGLVTWSRERECRKTTVELIAALSWTWPMHMTAIVTNGGIVPTRSPFWELVPRWPPSRVTSLRMSATVRRSRRWNTRRAVALQRVKSLSPDYWLIDFSI